MKLSGLWLQWTEWGKGISREVILKVIVLVQVTDGGWVEVTSMEMGRKCKNME